MHKCKFNDPKCLKKHRVFGCICGKGDKPEPEPVKEPDPLAQSRAQVQALQESLPQTAQIQYDILSDPNIGAQAQTQLFEDIRQNVFPNEQAVREQLVQNVLGQLASPTGLTQEQQQAVDLRRGQAQDEVQRALRMRSNLGGGLYGGRAQNTEQKAVQDLQAQFSEEDINREERNRLNNQALASSILQMLFPQSGIQTPQFINPVMSPNVQAQGTLSAQQSNQNAILQQQATDAALRSSLYNALGSAVGGAAQGAGAAMAAGCWVAKEIFGSWEHTKTRCARFYIHNIGPKWFSVFYMKHGEVIADFISNKPILKIMLRPLFEFFAFCGGLNAKALST